MNFDEELKTKQKAIEDIIKAYLPEETGYQKTVIKAMNYSVMAGGKRLRPMLMMEAFKVFGGKEYSGDVKVLEPFMAAIEMIHTYSLVHDDLPAMDNDEYRRGRKTTHIVYGEDMAILAGDGLLNFAYETAAKALDTDDEEVRPVIKAMKILTEKAGIYGMVGGQTADVEAENKNESMTLEQILFIHEHKTAALIQAALMIGAVLADANENQIKIMEEIGYNVGVAFQIQDDILDVTSSTEVLGKPVHSDEKNNKTTYVTLKGLEQAQHEQTNMSIEALSLMESFGWEDTFLYALIKSLITREK